MKLTITLYVQPGAKKSEVVGMHGDMLKIKLNAPPVEGQANAALLAWLSKQLDLKIKQLTLLRGEKSRIKTIAIELPQDSQLTQASLISRILKTN